MGDVLAPASALDQANRSGERHDVDPTCTGFPERRCRSVGRRACRVDVVDERHVARSRPDRTEGRDNVASPLTARELALPGRATDTDEKRLDAAVPPAGQLTGKPLGRMMAAPQAPVRVRRHEREEISRRPLDNLDEDCSRPSRQPPEATLLPGRDDPPHRRVVLDRATRTGEREPPSRALRAALHRPCRRRAAAFAPRRNDSSQAGRAGATDVFARCRAAKAALR